MAVVTVTLNPCIDKTFSVERVIPDRKLVASEVKLYPGGGGLNVARVVRELGGEVRALWTCGGTTGERLAGLLDEEGVPHAPVPVRELVRENLIVGERSSDDQYRFGMPGPELDAREREEWTRRVGELAPAPRHVVLSGSLPRGVSDAWYGELIGCVPEESRVVVDTKRQALERALERGVYLVKPNLHELEEVAGRELSGDDAIEQAAREVIERGGAEVVLVSLGAGGALLVDGDGCERLAPPTVPVRSRIGAGDSMVGGLVRALDEGRPLRDAACFGVAAGAAAVMTEGTALCRREDVLQLFEGMQKRRESA